MAKKHGVDGNKNAEKFPTPQARQDAYLKFCKHIRDGYHHSSFHKPCTSKTIFNLIKQYPEEFDPDLLEQAAAEGRFVWEEMGKKGTNGQIDGFNASSWWRIMQNKLNWKDRTEVAGDPENPLTVSGGGALSKEEQAVLDHFKRKVIYEIEHHSDGKGKLRK